MIEDWDAAYDNSRREADAPAIFADWAARGAAFRAAAPRAALDLPYGPDPREKLDLFLPDGAPAGLIVFLHGGYWKAMSREPSAWIAAGPLARGWAVAIPSYPLAPAARLTAIARSAAAAVGVAAARVGGPLVLTGHSAGGHLAARLASDDGLLAPALAARLARVVGISGLYDLRPLLRTAMNATLRLDPAEAAAESPALRAPLPGLAMTAWVGGDENPEFLRQTALIANVWTGLGADMRVVIPPGQRHFHVVEPLADPASDLVGALTGARAGG